MDNDERIMSEGRCWCGWRLPAIGLAFECKPSPYEVTIRCPECGRECEQTSDQAKDGDLPEDVKVTVDLLQGN